jgi:hypothetical protein
MEILQNMQTENLTEFFKQYRQLVSKHHCEISGENLMVKDLPTSSEYPLEDVQVAWITGATLEKQYT